MVEIRPGVAQADLDAILAEPRGIERDLLAAGVPPVRADQCIAGGTLFVDGAPKVAGCVVEVGPKVGLMCMLSSVDLRKYARHVVRATRACIEQAEGRGFTLLATVPIDWPGAIALTEHLGFTPAGRPDKLGHRLYVKRK